MPEHVDIPTTEIHIAHNFSYADAATREADTSVVSADIGKIARQEDNNSFWVLTATTPVWVRLSVGAVVNAQTGTTYTVLAKDRGKLVTHTNASSIAVTLPQANTTGFGADWCYYTQNRGAGVVTITPTTSTIDGAATLVLNKGEGALIVSDGTNYFTVRGIIGAVTQILDANGNEVLKFGSTASAVNEVTITNKATGTGPTIAATGGDTDIALNLVPKGIGELQYNGTEVGFRNIPQNSQSAAYTTVLTDRGKHIYHPVGDNNARTFTIDSNANVAYPIGTCITFVNDKNTVTIAITSDTLVWAEDGSTGSRTLAENGMATAIKVTSTRWIISGTGLS